MLIPMVQRHDESASDVTIENTSKRTRVKKRPLWHRIIYEEQMVALVRLLGHEGMPLKELALKSQPLIEKFGKERLQEAADEIVEVVGNGDAAIVRLSEQAHKFAIQLLGQPRFKSSTNKAEKVSTPSTSSVRVAPSDVPKSTEASSSTIHPEPDRSPTIVDSSKPQPTSEVRDIESSYALAPDEILDTSRNWANYETKRIVAFLGGDRQFTDECLHLAERCFKPDEHDETSVSGFQADAQGRTQILAGQLQRLVCQYNPLADDASVFTDLLDSALNNVDWHDIANCFRDFVLNRPAEEDDET